MGNVSANHIQGSASRERGFALIEAVAASGIALIMALGVVGAFSRTLRTARTNMAYTQAAYLEEEGLEAMRILRDNGWTANIASHASGSTFYLSFDGTTWTSSSVNTFIDNSFERKVILNDVYRDVSQNIASSGTADSNTKLVTVTVSWRQDGATTTRSLKAYLTNVFNN